RAGAGLDLADHHPAVLRADEVDLALPAAPVAGEDLVALRAVPGRRLILAPCPQRAPGRGHRSRSGVASSSMFTSLNVTTRTDGTKRILVWRYMSHTHASRSSSSTRVR